MTEVVETITRLFDKFDKDIERLDKIPEATKEATQKLAKVLYSPKMFFKPELFTEPFRDIADDVGHAYTTVLLIDLERQRISPARAQEYMSVFQQVAQRQPNTQPIMIQQPAAQQLGLFSGYWNKKIAEEHTKAMRQDIPVVANITTDQPVTDVLEHGRQLIPNLNLLYLTFEVDVLLMQRRSDPSTLNNLTFEIRVFTTNLFTVIRSFSHAGVEYRKELVGQRKQETAKALVALQMAQYQALAGCSRAPYMQDPLGGMMKKRIRDQ